MNKHVAFQSLLGAAVLAALLLAVGLLLRPALAAPRIQEDVPELAIVKTVGGDGSIGPGDAVRFTIVVTNTGSITATNVTVRDDYDQTALPTIQILSEVEQGPSSAQNDGDIITWQLGDLAPGAGWSASYEATATEAFGTAEVSNIVSAEADNAEVVQAVVVLTVEAPQLTLTLERERVEGEGRIFPGDTVRYTIRYINNGTADATNVVLEATFDETIVQQVDNITDDGQRDGATVRWKLGAVAAGASGDVSCEVMLKSVLPPDSKVRSQAVISADYVEPVSASDTFAPPPPLVVERQREDLNGGAIEPGDTLRFIVRFRNAGTVEASDVVVCDDFDERVVAEVSDISDGGGEVGGTVEWVLADPLGPGVEKTVSYKVRLIGEVGESTTAANTVIISISGVEVDRAQTTMTIEPPPEKAVPVSPVVPVTPRFFEDQQAVVALLVGLSTAVALVAVGVLALLLLRKGEWKDWYFRLVIEGVVVIVIAEAVLVLAMNENIESDGAVSILSSVAGYVLGRTMIGGSGGGSSGGSDS